MYNRVDRRGRFLGGSDWWSWGLRGARLTDDLGSDIRPISQFMRKGAACFDFAGHQG